MSGEVALVEVVTTVGSEEDAARLARSLVEARLAACANVAACRSLYRWRGELVDEAEVQVALKTTAARAPALEDRLRAEHPYDTPAVLTLPVLRADARYAAWVAACVEAGGAA